MFDSGVGGLTVLNALRHALPDESFVYLGDTARVPYGSKPLAMVRGFAEEIVAELVGRGVKGIVIACNTASAAALPGIALTAPVPVWGVVEPGVRAALRVAGSARGRRVGVLGTQATVGARVYQDRLEAAGAATWAKACPLFVPIVEEGLAAGPGSEIADLVADHYLQERPELDAIILGCTHYPALKPVLRRVLGPEVALVDSADEVAAAVRADLEVVGLRVGDLEAAGLQADGPQAAGPGTARPRSAGEELGSVHYVVTGDVAAFMHTGAVLGMPEGTAEHLDVARLVSGRLAPGGASARPRAATSR